MVQLLHLLHVLATYAQHQHDLRSLLAHERWLIHHHHTHRALLELRQVVWALRHHLPVS